MRFQPRRTLRYYYLRFLRLEGDPTTIARGVALGVFIGITPTLPLHTVSILVAAPLLRANLIAALLAATAVSNPLTIPGQYYLSWRVGDMLLPCHVSWAEIRGLLELITSGEAGFRATLTAFTHLGSATLATLLVGGLVLATPPAVLAYFWSHWAVRRFRQRRHRRHRLE